MILNSCAELDDLGGGRFSSLINPRPIAYLDNGSWQRTVGLWVAGDVNFPHILTTGPFMSYITSQGDWRIHPTRDPGVWVSIGAPYVNPANPVRATLNPFTRSGNTLTSVNTNYDARIIFGGHLLKLEFPLKNGFVPPQSRVAFPISARGVTWVGTALQVNGVTVMNLTPPVVYDAANRLDVRPIAVTFQSVSGQLYIVFTLPSLAGMTSPVIDPTLTLQPDATAGKDACIQQANPTTNYGTDTFLAIADFAGFWRFLLQFDLSSIPANSTVSTSTLTLYTDNNFGLPVTCDIHRVTRSWTEAGATWNKYDGSSAWTTAGGDFAATVYATQTFATDVNFVQDIAALVQLWVNGTANNGLLGRQSNEGSASSQYFVWRSSDHATANTRPKLVTVYTEPVGGGGIFASSIPHSAIFGGGVVR